MDLLGKLVEENASSWISTLTEGSGLDRDEAERFVPEAARAAVEQLGGGSLDLGSLLGGGGGASALLQQLDVSSLAGTLGIDETRVSEALERFLPALLSALGTGGGSAAGLRSLLGGGSPSGGLAGAAGKLAGRLFGKN